MRLCCRTTAVGALQIRTPSEQVAAHLKKQIRSGHYQKLMPGMETLAKELGIDPKTASLALVHLEKENVLVSQGKGKRRRILSRITRPQQGYRIGVLSYTDRQPDYIFEITHQLREDGHQVVFTRHSLIEMKMNVEKVAQEVQNTPVDAWLVVSGSTEVLEWFSRQPAPCFALFGRRGSLNIPGINVVTAEGFREAVTRLVELGHRRIVLITRRERREPTPGLGEQAFLDELQKHGLTAGAFNLPDWEETPEGFHDCLNALMAHTPPTAFLFSLPELFVAAHLHFSKQGIRVPEDISLMSAIYDETFVWCRPDMAHLRWDSRPLVRRVLQWASHLARGKQDLRQTVIHTRFVEGGTIGPAKGPA